MRTADVVLHEYRKWADFAAWCRVLRLRILTPDWWGLQACRPLSHGPTHHGPGRYRSQPRFCHSTLGHANPKVNISKSTLHETKVWFRIVDAMLLLMTFLWFLGKRPNQLESVSPPKSEVVISMRSSCLSICHRLSTGRNSVMSYIYTIREIGLRMGASLS